MRLDERRRALETLLLDSEPYWRPSTFREQRPDWCRQWPALTAELLALDDATTASLSEDAARMTERLLPWLPMLQPLAALTALPAEAAGAPEADAAPIEVNNAEARASRDIPGRKLGQIDAFVAAVGRPQAPLVDWCAGKGHLSRRFLQRWGGEAVAVERNPALCDAGADLARRVRHPQRFLSADVMHGPMTDVLRGTHAVALHACGDLHRHLVRTAAAVRTPAIDIAPCCYPLTADEPYRPLLADSRLQLDRNALRLAVTETVTASRRDTAISRRDSAWKLAFLALREQVQPGHGYQSFLPVPAEWRRGGFADFLHRLAAREGVPLPAGFDFAACEATGWQRHHESRRLQLVRSVFRRAIEVWLLCDLAVWLERQGYAVSLREFCPRALTPRNLLLSARLL